MSERVLEETAQLPPEEAYEVLQKYLAELSEDIPYLTHLAEVALDVSDVDTAFHALTKACQLDPNAELGAEKFFSLGQITGSNEGIAFINIGLNKLRTQAETGVTTPQLVTKMIGAIFTAVEIWLTDLIEDDLALAQCRELLEFAHKLDDSNGEAYGLLAQVLILENNFSEAEAAVRRAWELFEARLSALAAEGGQDPFVYVEILQPMGSLVKLALETACYELASSMCQRVLEIDDNILEIYYYEALAHLMQLKQALGLDLDLEPLAIIEAASDNDQVQQLLNDARLALTQGYRVIQVSECDPDVVEQVEAMLKQMGGPNMKELMPQKDADVNVDGWEDELE